MGDIPDLHRIVPMWLKECNVKACSGTQVTIKWFVEDQVVELETGDAEDSVTYPLDCFDRHALDVNFPSLLDIAGAEDKNGRKYATIKLTL